MSVQHEDFTDAQLARFAHWQSVSFGVLSEVAALLAPGMTERDATRLAMKGYRREGADRYFHLPVALFGERTALPEPWSTGSFWPTARALEETDPVILDASPVFEGYVVDTAISFTLAPNDIHAQAVADDLAYRTIVLDAVRAGATFREIALTVDASMAAAGDRNCHQLHPEGVLGHRAVRLLDPSAIPAADDSGFDPTVLGWFLRGIARAQAGRGTPPTWTSAQLSDHRPSPGLWAVEPHLGRGEVGVKWEELLVVTDHDAHWLSDDVPHAGRGS